MYKIYGCIQNVYKLHIYTPSNLLHTHTPKTTSFPQKNLEFHGLASMDSFSFSKNKSGPKAPTNGARQRPHVRLDGDGIP